jgi:VanZ family protein
MESRLMRMSSVLLYMVLLGFGTVITPGVGLAGTLLSLCPQHLTDFSHAPAYGLLTWLLTNGLRECGWPKSMALWVGALVAMVFGLSMETLQGFVPGRYVEMGDIVMNAIGIAMAALLILSAPERAALAKRPFTP